MKHHLSPVHSEVIVAIDQGDTTLKALITTIQLPEGAVQHALDTLIKAGLVEKSGDNFLLAENLSDTEEVVTYEADA